MKRNVLVLMVAFVLLSVSSTAFATLPECGGDCYGWSVGGSLIFGTPDYMDYEFTVELTQGATVVYSHFQEGSIHRDDADFVFFGEWGMELCGDYTMTIVFTIYGPWGTYTDSCTESFPCECGPPPTCTYTPGYWKNHIEAWPVEGLTVGCVYYTNAELLDIFDWPTEGDMTVILFHHLVAAKLNVLTGSDDYINDSIMAGDDFLCINLLGSSPEGNLKDDAEAIKDELCEYNELECEEEEEEDDMLSISAPKVKIDKAAATEESSWGAIKKKHN